LVNGGRWQDGDVFAAKRPFLWSKTVNPIFWLKTLPDAPLKRPRRKR